MIWRTNEVIITVIVVLFASMWAFIPSSPNEADTKEKDRITIKENSDIVRICKDGTVIYKYKDRYWVKPLFIDAAWLDPQVSPEKFCD